MVGSQSPIAARPPQGAAGAGAGRGQWGEGRGGAVLAIAAVLGLVGFAVVLLLFPALLAWLIAIGLLALALAAVAAVLIAVAVAMLTVGAGAYYLLKRHEVQGPEAGYTLDMVETPGREGR